jgi:hypothetical protein
MIILLLFLLIFFKFLKTIIQQIVDIVIIINHFYVFGKNNELVPFFLKTLFISIFPCSRWTIVFENPQEGKCLRIVKYSLLAFDQVLMIFGHV